MFGKLDSISSRLPQWANNPIKCIISIARQATVYHLLKNPEHFPQNEPNHFHSWHSSYFLANVPTFTSPLLQLPSPWRSFTTNHHLSSQTFHSFIHDNTLESWQSSKIVLRSATTTDRPALLAQIRCCLLPVRMVGCYHTTFGVDSLLAQELLLLCR